jgi:hypothetical protein
MHTLQEILPCWIIIMGIELSVVIFFVRTANRAE